jgi:hypothetical protein
MQPGALSIYRSIRTRPPHNTHTTVTTHNFIIQKSNLACNSEGTDEFPDDGAQLLKQVEAAK